MNSSNTGIGSRGQMTYPCMILMCDAFQLLLIPELSWLVLYCVDPKLFYYSQNISLCFHHCGLTNFVVYTENPQRVVIKCVCLFSNK